MTKRLLVPLVALAMAMGLAPAAYAVTPSADPGCAFIGATDYNGEAQDGIVTGLMLGFISQNGTLTCTIKPGASTHSAPDSVYGTRSEATGTNGVTVIADIRTYLALDGMSAYLCDKFRDATGTTYYWDGARDRWTTDANAECEQMIRFNTEDETVFVEADRAVDAVTGLVQQVACGVLAAMTGVYGPVTISNQGDVFLLGGARYDCPPYDRFGSPFTVLLPGFDLVVGYHLPESLSTAT